VVSLIKILCYLVKVIGLAGLIGFTFYRFFKNDICDWSIFQIASLVVGDLTVCCGVINKYDSIVDISPKLVEVVKPLPIHKVQIKEIVLEIQPTEFRLNVRILNVGALVQCDELRVMVKIDGHEKVFYFGKVLKIQPNECEPIILRSPIEYPFDVDEIKFGHLKLKYQQNGNEEKFGDVDFNVQDLRS